MNIELTIKFTLDESFCRVHNLRKGVSTMSEDLTQPLPNDGVQLILRSLENLNGRMTALEDRMTGLEGRMTGLEDRMTALEDKVDRRLMETRPIWEQVLSRLDGIDARLDKIEKRLDKVESEVYSLNRKFRVFYDDVHKLQDKQEDLEERVARLKPESTQ
jgi:predicted nuclease with TOPRIM domain